MNIGKSSLLLAVLVAGLAACGQDEELTAPPTPEQTKTQAPAPEPEVAPAPRKEAMAYFIAPAHEAEVSSPVRIKFGLLGMDVAPAGTETPNTGHHHLLIDVDELPPLDMPIPSDEHHHHFGKGQTEVMLDLPPGEHTLRLLLGDGNHVPHDPPVVSEPITITVIAVEAEGAN